MPTPPTRCADCRCHESKGVHGASQRLLNDHVDTTHCFKQIGWLPAVTGAAQRARQPLDRRLPGDGPLRACSTMTTKPCRNAS